MSNKIRCFLAIDLTGEIKDYLYTQFNALLTNHDYRKDIKWVEKQNLHFTMKFLGDVNKTTIPSISNQLQTGILQFRNFEITVSGTGAFPNLKRPRVLWLGLKTDSDILPKLKNEIEFTMERFDFERENKKFSPHLTLGRIKRHARPIESSKLAQKFSEIEFTPQRYSINHITLYQSVLTNSGPIYTALNKFKLRTE